MVNQTIIHIIYYVISVIAINTLYDNTLVMIQYTQSIFHMGRVDWDVMPFIVTIELLCIFTMYVIIDKYKTDIKWSEIA